MNNNDLKFVLNRVYSSDSPDRADIEYLLNLSDESQTAELFAFADEIRRQYVGDEVLLRGIVEFSNNCDNTCHYCGLNRTNKNLIRYSFSDSEILGCIKHIADSGIKTVVLQSGESAELDAGRLADIIRIIKTDFDMAVTLSVGERKFEDYKLWKQAGADRYLLKIETTNKDLYRKLHPGMSFDNRLECSRNLKKLGYQNGSGNLVGLPGQTISDIAEDILFFKKERFDMIGIGPFIPHHDTVLCNNSTGDIKLTLKTIAITRIVTRNSHLPASTAVGSVNGKDERITALKAGANVLMPNFTPLPYRQLYEIYPNKRCSTEEPGKCGVCMDIMVKSIGRTIKYSRGDSLKKALEYA
ncbi:MAG: [FeFe] hydrogenase H-cluster radical SAM maturase HydE [Phycisphaerae bacterium]